jgi:hypothetical protein
VNGAVSCELGAKKGTVPTPEEPIVSEHRVMSVPASHPREAGRLLITELRYRLFAASRALIAFVRHVCSRECGIKSWPP